MRVLRVVLLVATFAGDAFAAGETEDSIREAVPAHPDPPRDPYETRVSTTRSAFELSMMMSPYFATVFDETDEVRWTWVIIRLAPGLQFRAKQAFISPGVFYEASNRAPVAGGPQIRFRFGLLALEAAGVLDAGPALGGRFAAGVMFGDPIGVLLELQRRTFPDGEATMVGLSVTGALTIGKNGVTGKGDVGR
jgi:hypothetical protein